MEKLHIRKHLTAAKERAEDLNNYMAIENLCRALAEVERVVNVHAAQIAALAPESAPPVPVTIPDAPPAAAGMTAEEFYTQFEAIEQAARRCRDFDNIMVAVTYACDLGARWRAATGLPLPTRPRKGSR